MHKALFFRSKADGLHCLQCCPRERSRENKDRVSERKKENFPQRQTVREEM